MGAPPKNPRRRYSEDEIEKGLTAYAIAGTYPLAAQYCGLPQTSIRNWVKTRSDQFERIWNEQEQRRIKRIAGAAEQIAAELTDLERMIVQSFTEDEIQRMDPDKRGSLIRNVTTSKALQFDRISSPLMERPSHVQAGQDIEGLMQKMARFLGSPAPVPVANLAESNASEST